MGSTQPRERCNHEYRREVIIDKKLAALEAKRQRIIEAFFDWRYRQDGTRKPESPKWKAISPAFRKILLDTVPAVSV